MPIFFIIKYNGLDEDGGFLPLLPRIWPLAGWFCRFLDSGFRLELFGVAFERDFTTIQIIYKKVTANEARLCT